MKKRRCWNKKRLKKSSSAPQHSWLEWANFISHGWICEETDARKESNEKPGHEEKRVGSGRKAGTAEGGKLVAMKTITEKKKRGSGGTVESVSRKTPIWVQESVRKC